MLVFLHYICIVYLRIYVFMCLRDGRLYVCMYVCIYECMYICKYVLVCMYVCMYVCVCIHAGRLFMHVHA